MIRFVLDVPLYPCVEYPIRPDIARTPSSHTPLATRGLLPLELKQLHEPEFSDPVEHKIKIYGRHMRTPKLTFKALCE